MDVLRTYFTPSSRLGGPAAPKGKAAQLAASTSFGRLLPLFYAWKTILVLAAGLSPGPGYDTSTRIYFDDRSSSSSWPATLLDHLALRLTRWDAIYFTSAAEHGKQYEQEWAFSPVFSNLTSAVATVLFWPFSFPSVIKHALTGVLVSNVAHLLAVFVLYRLVYELVPATPARKRKLAYITAALHILSPAGIFLCAPFGESTFALGNFLGMLCYVFAVQAKFSDAQLAEVPRHARAQEALWTIGAGICFAAASTIRSNGLLSGIIFAWDAVSFNPFQPTRVRDKYEILRIVPTILAGTILAVAFTAPQAVAYIEYCTASSPRPWCSAIPPSIYSFVQSHYWNVGFLRYWTLSNLPLFALAFPLGWLMVETTLPALLQTEHMTRTICGQVKRANASNTTQEQIDPSIAAEKVLQHVLPRLAVPQLVLVVMAATSFHVQILNRISSGYPLWYFVLAIEVCDVTARSRGLFGVLGKYSWTTSKALVRVMMAYAMVQGGLYAAFLPPA